MLNYSTHASLKEMRLLLQTRYPYLVHDISLAGYVHNTMIFKRVEYAMSVSLYSVLDYYTLFYHQLSPL